MPNDFIEVAKWLWGAVIPWNVYLHRKIDKANEDNVKREEFNGTVGALRDEIHEGNKQITQRLDTLLLTMVNRRDKE